MKPLNLVHLNALKSVEAVARLGSLQAAADELGVSAGAVSQQVIKAEAQLGRALFERRPRGMVATAAALPVLQRLTAGFRLLGEAVAEGRRRDDTVLTISVAPVFAARWLVHRLDGFSAVQPHIRLRIDATTQLVDPALGDVDVCIRVGDGRWPGVVAEAFLAQEIFPVCTPQMAAGLSAPEDILRLPVVTDAHSSFTWETWLEAAGLGGRTITPRHVLNEASLCLDAVLAGQGVMLAWQTLASRSLEHGRLVAPFSIRARTGAGYYFVTPPGRRDPAKVAAFKSWVRAEMEADMIRLGFAEA